jgi:sec-independent protein translocase protein TatA
VVIRVGLPASAADGSAHMFGLRMPELLIIGFILVLLFGASKLPALGAGLGEGIRSFKKAFGGEDEKEKKVPPANDLPKGT